MRRSRAPVAAFAAWLAVVVAAPAAAAAAAGGQACDRDCLVDAMNLYLDAMVVTRTVEGLPLAPGALVKENGQPVVRGSGVFATARAIPYRHIFADARSGEVGVHAVAEEGGRFAVFSVRLKLEAGSITEVDTIVAREGQASLFAPEAMTVPDPLYEQSLEPHQRVSREQMIAAANGYYEGIVNADPSRVPAAPGCWRVENGVQTQRIPALVRSGHCNLGHDAFGYIKPIRERRYPLVDEARGLVWALVVMDIAASPAVLDAAGNVQRAAREPRSILVRELFKISAGKIRRMDVVMRDLPFGATSGWGR